MESGIQLAQMLADLSDLHAAQEAQASHALVNANKTLPPAPTSNPTKPTEMTTSEPQQRHHRRVQSASGIMARTASPAKFDKMGRRIFTPPLSRTNSAQGSTPGTPRREDPEDDIDRATSLMALYDIRNKLRQQDQTGLTKAREKIAALQAREKNAGLQARHQSEKKDPHHYQYTYPKSSS